MPRDRNVRTRDAFVIPGGLLVAYGLIGLLFVIGIRSPGYCDEETRILLAGSCYSLIPIGLLPILVGLVLLAVGLIRYRAEPDSLEGHLHHGSGLHFTLVFLASLVVIPLVGSASIRFLEEERGTEYGVRVGGILLQESFLFEAAAAVALAAFLPVALLAARQFVLRRRFLDAADRVADLHVQAPAPAPSQERLPPGEIVPEAAWPASRRAEASPEPVSPQRLAAVAPPPQAPPGSCHAATPNGLCGRPANAAGRYCQQHGCQAVTATGVPCPNPAGAGNAHCALHGS